MKQPAHQPMDQASVERAADLIRQADALIIAAGAGMVVDSGLPDFHGQDGFWRAYPALREAQVDFYSIASPAAFHSSPGLAWGFYGLRLALYRKTLPHHGFGQFHKAGFDPSQIHECHGSIHHLQCLQLCCAAIWPAVNFQPEVDEESCQLRNPAPRCPQCDGLARPNVLMFSDWGWIEDRTAAQASRQEAWLSAVARPVVIELGAGTAIPSVRHFSQRVIHEFGGRLVRINPRESEVPTRLDVGLPVRAVAGLAAIAQVLGPAWTGHGKGQ